jgi:DNA-binding MarR family transcriptional regulator
MSGETLFDVMNCDGFPKPAMKLLLVALADRADETGVCWPSRDDLRLRTGLSDSSITRTARALERGEWIQRKQRRDASTVYRLNLLKIARTARESKAARRLRRAGGEWQPFSEERVQALENNGEGHTDPTSGQTDPTSGQTDPTSGQGDHVTSQEPLTETLARDARAARGRARSPQCSGEHAPAQGEAETEAHSAEGEAEAVAASLGRYAASRLRDGHAVAANGSLVVPGTPHGDAVLAALVARDGAGGTGGERRDCAEGEVSTANASPGAATAAHVSTCARALAAPAARSAGGSGGRCDA